MIWSARFSAVSDTLPRATFSSLRARREAYQVASDILYEEPIDVRTVACSGCGQWIDVHAHTVTDPLICPSCAARTPLPPYLRAKYLPRQLPVLLNYAPDTDEEYGFVACEEEPMDVPRWLIWFNAIFLPLGIGVGAALLVWYLK
jgi:hypothetical protein